MQLGLLGSADRAGTSAGTAVDASIGVNLILGVAGGNGADRASALTSTAHDAGIRNLISHDSYLHFESIARNWAGFHVHYNMRTQKIKGIQWLATTKIG